MKNQLRKLTAMFLTVAIALNLSQIEAFRAYAADNTPEPVPVVVGHTDGVVTSDDVDSALEAAGITHDDPFTVTFEDGVTIIGDSAFYSTRGSKLTEITFPDSVTHINRDAFFACATLTEITLPENLTFIGNSAFRSCGSLKSINLPDSLTSIDGAAFLGCTSLTAISLPNNLTSISGEMFLGCTSLTEVNLPDSLTRINGGVFSRCTSLVEIVIPESVIYIEINAFIYTTVTFVVTAGSYAHGYAIHNNIPFRIPGMITIYVPEKTNNKTVTVRGLTEPLSDITVFANGKEVGIVNANAVGSYQLQFELDANTPVAFYEIYAEVVTPEGEMLTSAVKNLEYNETTVNVSKVTMLYNNQNIEFDFIDTSKRSPIYTPGKSFIFTFVVEFDTPNAEVDNVFVVVKGVDNRFYPLPAVYDERKQIWVANYNVSQNSLPMSVGVDYNEKDENAVQEVFMAADIDRNEYIELIESLDFSDYTTGLYEEDGFSVNVLTNTLSKPSNGELPVGEFLAELCDDEGYTAFLGVKSRVITQSELDGLIEQGKLEMFLDKDNNIQYMGRDIDNKYISFLYVDGETMTMLESKAYSEQQTQPLITPFASLNTFNAATIKPLSAGWGLGVASNAVIHARLLPLQERLFQIRDGICNGCALGCDTHWAYASVHHDKVRNALEYTQKEINELREEASLDPIDMAGDYAIDRLLSLNPAVAITYNIFQGLDMGVRLAVAIPVIEQRLDLADGIRFYCDNHHSCDAPPPSPGSPEPTRQPMARMTPVIDPSGYVYEAVPSNRVTGATAICYYAGDDYQYDEAAPTQTAAEMGLEPWNAEDYDQYNPLTTDWEGRYAWDVPPGWWQVKIVKDGFDTVFSEWMPVPPEQTKINIGMISTAAPTVQTVNAYPNAVEIVFDKYMDVTGVTNANVTVTQNGVSVAGSVVPMNAEESIDPETEYSNYIDGTFATVFRFIPSNDVLLEDTVKVEINKAVKSYAGTAMTADYSADVEVKYEPTGIDALDTITLEYGEEKQITAQILPLQAGENRKVTARSGSDFIATIDSEKTTDNNSTATFTITGEMTGQTQVTLSIEGTQITHTINVNVLLPGQMSAPVVPAVPQDFTATPGNGQIALSWTAPASDGGAEITRYEVSKDNGVSWVTASSNTGHTFTGLTNGTNYAFKVRAVNSVGNGAEASVTAMPNGGGNICNICGTVNCTKTHIYCDICKKHDCGKKHVYCDTCKKYDCGINHTPNVMFGDVDGDKKITISDALEILKNLAGMKSKIEKGKDTFTAADIDKDGKITISDALEVLKKLAGMSNKIDNP